MGHHRQGSKNKSGNAALRHRVNAAKAAVEDQIDFFQKQFGQVKSEWKEDDTRVTFADFAISEKIFASLRRHFPEDDFCSEESNPQDEIQQLEADFAWVLDPIDGTNNYALGMPIAAISLGLLQEGMPIYGVIYDSNRNVLVHGGPGFGVFQGKSRFLPKAGDSSETRPMSDFTFGTSFPMSDAQLDFIRPLLERFRVRAIGSSTLSVLYSAIGLFDGALDFKVKVWDIAAAAAIVEAVEKPFSFFSAPVFPLKQFHPRLPSCPFYTGSVRFCGEVERLLKRTGNRPD